MQKGFPADLCLISALSARNCCYGCFTLGALIFWRRSDDWMALVGALAVVGSVAF
jgi:hypothetical protein